MSKTVKMVNSEGKFADVHPDEVENYSKAGFTKVDAPKKKRAVKKEAD